MKKYMQMAHTMVAVVFGKLPVVQPRQYQNFNGLMQFPGPKTSQDVACGLRGVFIAGFDSNPCRIESNPCLK